MKFNSPIVIVREMAAAVVKKKWKLYFAKCLQSNRSTHLEMRNYSDNWRKSCNVNTDRTLEVYGKVSAEQNVE